MDVKISVIVPVYKVEQFLDDCVKSILTQTYLNIEVILVDDGSPDKCPQMCDEYAVLDSRVVVIHKENGGLSDARNAGIRKATGDYVIFIDSDDYWVDSSALSKLVDVISDDPTNDIVFFGRTSFMGDKVFHGPTVISDINGLAKEKSLETTLREAAFIGSACQKLIRRELIRDNEIYFKKGLLSEDWDWSISLYLFAKKFASIPDNLYGYRKRAESITQSFSLKHANDILYIIKKWSNTLPKTNEMRPFWGFLAYVLCCTLGCIEKLPKKDKAILKEFKPYAYLLSYDSNPKVKQVRKLYRLFGFTLTGKILGYYLKYRPKRLK